MTHGRRFVWSWSTEEEGQCSIPFLGAFANLRKVTVSFDMSVCKGGRVKYLGANLTDQNSIQEEIKSRLKSRNACYHSVQNLLSSSLVPKNLKIKIYRTIILPVVLCGCETWSLTLREEHRLRVFENRVLRGIFGPKKDEVRGECRKLQNEEF